MRAIDIQSGDTDVGSMGVSPRSRASRRRPSASAPMVRPSWEAVLCATQQSLEERSVVTRACGGDLGDPVLDSDVECVVAHLQRVVKMALASCRRGSLERRRHATDTSADLTLRRVARGGP